MKDEQSHKQEIRLFFLYIIISSTIAIANTTFEGKTRIEVLNDLFLRYMSGLIIGIFSSLGILIGRALFYYLQKKFKKDAKHDG